MLWTQIEVVTHVEASEAVANFFWEIGTNGVSLREQDEQVILTAYLPTDAHLEQHVASLRRLLAELDDYGLSVGEARIQLTPIEDEDWANSWKSAFPPQRIGRHWLVAPTWEKISPQPGDRLIRLDPGMAFGTGYHPTTQLVLCLLEETMQGGERALDLGTGSGILAIAAVILGAATVTATDIDPQALSIAQKNAQENGVAAQIRWVQGDLFEGVEGHYDLIMANILTKVLLPLISNAPAFLAPHGRMILSGILIHEDPLIRQALRRAGFECVRTMDQEEWRAYLVRRRKDCP